MSRDTSTTPSEYSVPPVNPKSLKNADNHPWNNKEVKNLQGEKLGTIDHVMIDTKSGKNVYAMLKLSENAQPMPIPFNKIQESKQGLVLNASKAQLQRGGPNLGGDTKSQDFEHMGSEPLKPNLRQGGGG
jgi:sporulation protein YlmC with PRC-barrel domain